LKFSLVDLVSKKLRLVGDEIVEADSDARDRVAVVIHHGKAEADGEKQARKIVELERMLATGGGKGRFDSKPDNKDRGESSEEVLAHSVEEAEILGEQIVDRLKDELQEVWLLHGVGSFDLGYISAHSYGMRKF
jgi:hypothetical protein